MRKTAFFRLFFARRSAKSVRKQCFFTSFRTLCQSSQKKRFFLRDVPQKVWENSFFFTFFETLCTKFAENAKNSVFWAFCSTFHKKFEETVYFHVFRNTLCIVSKKCEKQRFLGFFCATFRKKCKKTVIFSRFSGHFIQSSQKMRKTFFFFELFARRSTKSLRKQCIFTFFETLCA